MEIPAARGQRRVQGCRPPARCTRVGARKQNSSYYDVAVIGGGSVGLATAASLTRRGLKVVLIGKFAPFARIPPTHARRHLRLLHEDPALADLAQQAHDYWRGFEWTAPGVLHTAGTLDVGPTDSSPGGAAFSGLVEAGEAAGYQVLSPTATAARFPSMMLQKGQLAVWCPQGGTLDSGKESALLAAMTERTGGRLLQGWHLQEWEDRGTHFQLHAVLPAAPPTPTLEEVTTVQDARADDEARESAHREEVDESLRASAGAAAILPRGPLREEMWLEVEQVVLAPTVWPKESLEIFNAQYAVEAMVSRTYTRPGTAAWEGFLPATRLLLPASREALDLGAEDQACALLAADPSTGRHLLLQPPLQGIQLDGQQLAISSAQFARRDWLAGTVSTAQRAARRFMPDYAAPTDEATSRGSTSTSSSRSRPRKAEATTRAAHGFQHHIVTRDGKPALGWHAGFQDGRVAIALPSSGGVAGGIDGHHLGPLIGAAAAEMCAMTSRHALSAPEFQLNRGAMSMDRDESAEEPVDSKVDVRA